MRRIERDIPCNSDNNYCACFSPTSQTAGHHDERAEYITAGKAWQTEN